MFINLVANKSGSILIVAGESTSQDLIFDPGCNLSEAVLLVSQLLKCAQNEKAFHPSDIKGLSRWTTEVNSDSLNSKL